MNMPARKGDWILLPRTADDVRNNLYVYWRKLPDGREEYHRIKVIPESDLDAIKATRNATNPHDPFGDYHLIGCVPAQVWQQSGLQEAAKDEDWNRIRRWLDDSDHEAFKATSKRLIAK